MSQCTITRRESSATSASTQGPQWIHNDNYPHTCCPFCSNCPILASGAHPAALVPLTSRLIVSDHLNSPSLKAGYKLEDTQALLYIISDSAKGNTSGTYNTKATHYSVPTAWIAQAFLKTHHSPTRSHSSFYWGEARVWMKPEDSSIHRLD